MIDIANRPAGSETPSESIGELTAGELDTVPGAAALQLVGLGTVSPAATAHPGGVNAVLCDGSVRLIS
jgi:prepilin-type processing-associated H-X9-DG protein